METIKRGWLISKILEWIALHVKNEDLFYMLDFRLEKDGVQDDSASIEHLDGTIRYIETTVTTKNKIYK